ncbi:MAG: carboxypeptidase-like regulatory domain-containing protein [Bryobacteraceae bacterium]
MKKGAGVLWFTASLLLAGAVPGYAQTGGQAEIAFQGYYLGGDFNELTDITGMAANFRTFFPGLGVVTGNIETLGGEGKFRSGDNYIDMNGATWYGMRWRLTGGDFHVPTALVPSPFTNTFLPELAGEGLKIEASTASRRYTFFYGVETLAAGPRVPFRIKVPQKVLGASVVDRIGEKVELGARAIYVSTNPDSASNYLFAPGQDFRTTATISSNLLYRASANLQFYGEATASITSASAAFPSARQSPLSFTVGPTWKSRKLTIKANYIHQTASYLPLAGYFLGDRSGPYVEAQFKPIEAIELFGSASESRNNIGHLADLPTFQSKSTSAGGSLSLPSRFSLSGQLSTIDFSVKQPGTDGFSRSHNRQLIGTLGRAIRNHNLHFSYRDLNILSGGTKERQRSAEIEDVVQFKRLSLGGAVRDQRLIAEQSKDTLFIRGSAQVQYGRLSAYAYVEHGDDLANRTVFLTNTFNTTVLGSSVRIGKTWNVKFEMSRNQLTTDLSAENVFLLQNQGAFVTNAVTGLNQWTAYFRLSKSIRWGHGLPSGDLDKYAAEEMPIVGAIEGTVVQQGASGRAPVQDIPVILDDGRVVTTNESGRFRFARVREGRHRVSVAVNQLPTDYDPGMALEATVDVKPRHIVNAELSVTALVSFFGRIIGPEGTALDGVLVKLLTTDRYTTPTSDGRFAFYNLPEGEYDLTIDPKRLPEFAVLDRTSEHISLKRGTQPEEPTFRLSVQKPEKPIHRGFEKQ